MVTIRVRLRESYCTFT